MLISPIRLTELISFCDSGVLAFDVFVSDVPSVDCVFVCEGDLFIPRPNSTLNIQTNSCTSLQSKFRPKHNWSLGTDEIELGPILVPLCEGCCAVNRC